MATKQKLKTASITFARTPKVPNFSEAAIYIADLCARESWLGKSYQTGKRKNQKLDIETIGEEGEINNETLSTFLSDENFLIVFATQLLSNAGVSGVRTHKGGNSITFNNFGALLDAAELNSAVNTNMTTVDIDNGLNYLKNDLANDYKIWNKNNYKNPNTDLPKQMVKELSGELCIQEKGIPLGNQPAIASRLLNYGFPDLCVYNFSSEIHGELKISNNNYSIVIDKYYALLNEGYQRNWHLLSKHEMPVSTKVNEVVWQKARNGGWWQRRVYDLALKMYFSNDEKHHYFSSFSPSVQENIFTKARAF